MTVWNRNKVNPIAIISYTHKHIHKHPIISLTTTLWITVRYKILWILLCLCPSIHWSIYFLLLILLGVEGWINQLLFWTEMYQFRSPIVWCALNRFLYIISPVLSAGCPSQQLWCPTSRTHSQCRRHGNWRPITQKITEETADAGVGDQTDDCSTSPLREKRQRQKGR